VGSALIVGAAVGVPVGAAVGVPVGAPVGAPVGSALIVGAVVGVPVGAATGVPVGAPVGAPVGSALIVGAAVGTNDWESALCTSEDKAISDRIATFIIRSSLYRDFKKINQKRMMITHWRRSLSLQSYSPSLQSVDSH
jgi:hypothetical protein